MLRFNRQAWAYRAQVSNSPATTGCLCACVSPLPLYPFLSSPFPSLTQCRAGDCHARQLCSASVMPGRGPQCRRRNHTSVCLAGASVCLSSGCFGVAIFWATFTRLCVVQPWLAAVEYKLAYMPQHLGVFPPPPPGRPIPPPPKHLSSAARPKATPDSCVL